ncbi:uncharacterized protein LOC6554222 [Drosophila erecta]|uniref:GG11963 n=1 Tax=Drosophila erecta TaxID=7220 RepID=B3P7Y2_DROER|nr:uncharacterized protein LOC6554222 [Drosophila erecta]EDV53109.1 uncharacterized protein Dere_GG11963 [Drosophila erecta]
MTQYYVFDVILVNSTLPVPRKSASFSAGGRPIYSVRLFEDFEELSMERIFVDQFPADALGGFTTSPCELIGALTSKGVGVTLKENDELIGAGNAMLDSPVLRQLTDPTFSVTQNVVVKLTKGPKQDRVGEVELILKISSAPPDINHGLIPFGCYDVCKPVDQSINKKDIIFTLGRSGKCATNSCITDERLMSHAGAPFQCPHAASQNQEGQDNKGGASSRCGCFLKGMQLPPDVSTEKKRENSALKKLIDELGLDRIKVPSPPDSHEKSHRWHCKSMPPSSTTDTSSCDINEFKAEKPPRKRKALSLTASMEQGARRRLIGTCPVKEPVLKQEPYKPPNLCQLCRSDISWLPKISACPYCGYKTFDDIQSSEQPYDLTATAQQLLRDCLRKEPCELDQSADEEAKGDRIRREQDKDDPNVPKQCGCQGGKPCTRCRIRKLCDNFFKENECKAAPLPQAYPTAAAKSQPEKKDVGQTKSDTSLRRSQLVSIFTEMRNMYGKKKGVDQADAVAEELRKECDAACRNSKSSKARRRARRALQKTLAEIDRAYPKPPKMQAKKKRTHHKRSRCYTFLKLKKEPKDSRIGHVDCISGSKHTGYCKIPCHMGWMWTKSEMARHKSWRPGAISRPIRQLMSYFLKDFPADNICLSRYHYRHRKGRKAQELEEPLVQHPTLHICRKGDEYIITLRPLKDPKALASSANPYADMKPVVFRITKDPMAAGLRQMRVNLQDKGFAPCTCRRPVASCFCRSHVEKKRIQYEVENECRQRGWPNNSDTFVYSPNSDEDDSDREYEFGVTPPAGVIKPDRMRRPDRAHVETQYVDHDWAAPTMYPHPANMLVQYGGCVMGERKNMFPWIYGKGDVHADPPKPRLRNPPKKKPRKQLPFRNVGGYDDPRRFEPTPLNRPWHRSY